MKLRGNRLKLSSGKVVKFGSSTKRAHFEKFAMAIKHGWKPKKK